MDFKQFMKMYQSFSDAVDKNHGNFGSIDPQSLQSKVSLKMDPINPLDKDLQEQFQEDLIRKKLSETSEKKEKGVKISSDHSKFYDSWDAFHYLMMLNQEEMGKLDEKTVGNYLRKIFGIPSEEELAEAVVIISCIATMDLNKLNIQDSAAICSDIVRLSNTIKRVISKRPDIIDLDKLKKDVVMEGGNDEEEDGDASK